MKKIFSIALYAALAIMIPLSSCKKVDNSPAPTPTGILAFHLHTNIDTAECDSGTIATDATGRKFQLNIAQMYISGVKLKKMDGTFYTVSNAVILKTIAEEEYVIASVPAGNYSSVSFNVGLDAATDQTDPSTYPASSPLSPQNPSMWFGSTAQGYMFVNVQGLADTTATHTGPVNSAFSYQVGTPALLKTVDMPQKNFVVLAGQEQFVHMIIDYGVLLQGVNFKTQSTATPFSNLPVATQIANNIPAAFHYED